MELIYSKESDGGSDSKKTPRSPESTGEAEYEPSNRTRSGSQTHDHYHSLFSSVDENANSSPTPTTEHSPISKYDDGLRHRDGDSSGTNSSVSTTQEAMDCSVLLLAPDSKPWIIPERFVNELSGETSNHNRIPSFDARVLYGLNMSASNFRAEQDVCLDAFLKHRWYSCNTKRDNISLL